MTKLIELDNLTKEYNGQVVLKGIHLDINEKEFVTLLGPSGCGKTTTLRIMGGFEEANGGRVLFDGQDISSLPPYKRELNTVFQKYALFPHMNVYDNIAFGLKIKKMSKDIIDQKVMKMLKLINLEGYEKKRPKKLSGGLLRRLNIACGIAHKPRLVILDEPTVAVDPQSRNKILEGICQMNRQGSTIIYTSHYMEEVEQICSRIAILDKGRCLALGTKEELKNMIKTGEKVHIEGIHLTEGQLETIRHMPQVFSTVYEEGNLTLRFEGTGSHLLSLLHYMEEEHLTCGRCFSELPTLNDVFLEITGKELRD